MPNLGVLKGKELFEAEEADLEDPTVGRRATLADLPGLIEGAHSVRFFSPDHGSIFAGHLPPDWGFRKTFPSILRISLHLSRQKLSSTFMVDDSCLSMRLVTTLSLECILIGQRAWQDVLETPEKDKSNTSCYRRFSRYLLKFQVTIMLCLYSGKFSHMVRWNLPKHRSIPALAYFAPRELQCLAAHKAPFPTDSSTF